jgi:MFS family permease
MERVRMRNPDAFLPAIPYIELVMRETIRNSFRKKFQLFSRAFAYRNYRLYFYGQAFSVIGTWMQRIAMSWLVYRMTNSELLLGIVGFASNISDLLIAPFVGVIADRYDRRKIVIVTQSLAAVQALVLAILVLTNSIQVWQLIVLSFILGTIFAVDRPARQAFIKDIVENKEDLGNAIALNAILFNSARLIGPTIAGILVAVAGEGICFLINSVSYISVLIALVLIRIKQSVTPKKKPSMMKDFIEGARYSFGFKPIRTMLIIMAVVSFTSLPYLLLMPVFARDVLHGDSRTLGFLMGSVGVGAVIGGIIFALRKNVRGIGTHIARAIIMSIGLILFSQSTNLYLSMLFLAIVGFGQINTLAASNTAFQSMSEDEKRGRVLAFYYTAILGIAPFRDILSGYSAEKISAPTTVLIGAVISIFAAFVFFKQIPELRKIVRPIFISQGVKYD